MSSLYEVNSSQEQEYLDAEHLEWQKWLCEKNDNLEFESLTRTVNDWEDYWQGTKHSGSEEEYELENKIDWAAKKCAWDEQLYNDCENYEVECTTATVAHWEEYWEQDDELWYPCENQERNMKRLAFLRTDLVNKEDRSNKIKAQLHQRKRELNQFLIDESRSYKGFPRSEKQHREEQLAKTTGEANFPRSENTHLLKRLAELSAKHWLTNKLRTFKQAIDQFKDELRDATLHRDVADMSLEQFEGYMTIGGGNDYNVE